MSTTSPWGAWSGWWRTWPIGPTATCASLTASPSDSSSPEGPKLSHTALTGPCWKTSGPSWSTPQNLTTGDSLFNTVYTGQRFYYLHTHSTLYLVWCHPILMIPYRTLFMQAFLAMIPQMLLSNTWTKVCNSGGIFYSLAIHFIV